MLLYGIFVMFLVVFGMFGMFFGFGMFVEVDMFCVGVMFVGVNLMGG